SWRVPKTVQRAAMRPIERVRLRRPKVWSPRDEIGRVVRSQTIRDVDLSGPDVLILARNAHVAERLMPHLRAEGIIFEWRGHSSVRASVLEAIRCWEHLRGGG